MKAEVPQEWKELLLLLLGAFITSYGKIVDFWFSNSKKAHEFSEVEKDKKIEEEILPEQIQNDETIVS